jgi:hypothetical protein
MSFAALVRIFGESTRQQRKEPPSNRAQNSSHDRAFLDIGLAQGPDLQEITRERPASP